MHISKPSKQIRLVGNIPYGGRGKSFVAELRENIHRSPLHAHSYFEIECIVSGIGTTNINGKQFPLRRGTVSCMAPTDFHEIQTTEPITVWNLAIVDLPEIAEELFGSTTRLITMEEETFSNVLHLLSCIESEQTQNNGDGVDALCFEALLTLLLRKLSSPVRRGTPVFNALSYIRMNFRERITEQDVAKHVGFTGEHLSRKFKSMIGTGIKEYITVLRVHYSTQLLQTTDLTLSNVAMEAGFGNYSSFYRAFTKQTGVTPNEYRKTLLRK